MDWLHCGVIALLVLLVFNCINCFRIAVTVRRCLFPACISYGWKSQVMYTYHPVDIQSVRDTHRARIQNNR